MSFASLKVHGLERQQAELRDAGATEREQLDAARKQIDFLREQVNESEKYQQEFSSLHEIAEERAESAETQLRAATYRIQQLLDQFKAAGASPDEKIELPRKWEDFANWCDIHLAGRVILTPQARRGLRSPVFDDIELAARCLLWLANEYRIAKMEDSSGTLRDVTVATGVINAHCGSDVYKIEWQSNTHEVEWHIKNGGNTRDPVRCLRIYYFWDESTQEVVVTSMPAHRRTDAT
jgi:acetyl/propionyl-CoA carboxylase alpha subunit